MPYLQINRTVWMPNLANSISIAQHTNRFNSVLLCYIPFNMDITNRNPSSAHISPLLKSGDSIHNFIYDARKHIGYMQQSAEGCAGIDHHGTLTKDTQEGSIDPLVTVAQRVDPHSHNHDHYGDENKPKGDSSRCANMPEYTLTPRHGDWPRSDAILGARTMYRRSRMCPTAHPSYVWGAQLVFPDL